MTAALSSINIRENLKYTLVLPSRLFLRLFVAQQISLKESVIFHDLPGLSSTTFNPKFFNNLKTFFKMASIREMTSNFQNLDKFEGVGFCCWQKKMNFLLTTLKVAYVLNSPYSMETENETLE